MFEAESSMQYLNIVWKQVPDMGRTRNARSILGRQEAALILPSYTPKKAKNIFLKPLIQTDLKCYCKSFENDIENYIKDVQPPTLRLEILGWETKVSNLRTRSLFLC